MHEYLCHLTFGSFNFLQRDKHFVLVFDPFGNFGRTFNGDGFEEAIYFVLKFNNKLCKFNNMKNEAKQMFH